MVADSIRVTYGQSGVERPGGKSGLGVVKGQAAPVFFHQAVARDASHSDPATGCTPPYSRVPITWRVT
jgi:hypothetical protein